MIETKKLRFSSLLQAAWLHARRQDESVTMRDVANVLDAIDIEDVELTIATPLRRDGDEVLATFDIGDASRLPAASLVMDFFGIGQTSTGVWERLVATVDTDDLGHAIWNTIATPHELESCR